MHTHETQPVHGRQLIHFEAVDEQTRWQTVNDGVMGGISQSTMRITSEATAIFEGNVSLENSGGFASVRRSPHDYQLAGTNGLAIRVKGDGKRYQLRLRTDDQFDGTAYRALFDTLDGEWSTVRIPFNECAATFRGRPVPGAPSLTPESIRQIGFLIAEQQAGPFRLEIGWVKAYRD